MQRHEAFDQKMGPTYLCTTLAALLRAAGEKATAVIVLAAETALVLVPVCCCSEIYIVSLQGNINHMGSAYTLCWSEQV